MWRKWMALALAVLMLAGGLALAEEQVPEPLVCEPAPTLQPSDEGGNAPEVRPPDTAEPRKQVAQEETVEPPMPQPEESKAADGAAEDPAPQGDGVGDEPKAVEEPEGTMRLDLDEALRFWQDGSPELRYDWDEDSQCWIAEALPPVELPIYVTNASDRMIGPLNIVADARSATDEGGLYRLTCELLNAENLVLMPGEHRRIATFFLRGEGGSTDVACEQQLSIDLHAEYA